MKVLVKFQCPRGHFCFSGDKNHDLHVGQFIGFNAREGIFAFRTGLQAALRAHNDLRGFNAREGIFAFRTGYYPRR